MPYPDSASTSRSNKQDKPPSRRRRRRRPPHHYSPSKSLLSLLATVVADSTAASPAPAPLPLPFLYPTLDTHQQVAEKNLVSTQSQARLQRRSQQRTRFPEKYEQGTDGRWRRAEKYTLYGSTMCTNCGTSGIPPINDVAAPPTTDLSQTSSSSTAVSATPSLTCDKGESFEDCLPAGWAPVDRRDRTGIILAISLVLAFFICFFIIGCLLWRKSMRKMRDVEQKMKRKRARRTKEEDTESILEKQAKSKKKIWARATARWKANAHYTAWKRRGKRRAVIPADASSPSLAQLPVDEDDRSAIDPVSHHSSTAVSRRSSISTARSRSSSPTAIRRRSTTHAPSEDRPLTPPPPPSRPPSPLLASPPAYHHRNHSRSELAGVSASESSLHGLSSKSGSDALSTRPITTQTSSHFSARRSLSSPSDPPPLDEPHDDQPIAYSHSILGGHVATDDKATLQKLTQQASAPEAAVHPPQDMSAPVWEDEDIADFGNQRGDHSAPEPSSSARSPEFPPSPSRHHPLFPPLPSALPTSEKGKMAQYYEYEYTFEDDTQGSSPSAPPSFDYQGSMRDPQPSAPPLEATAPDEEDALEYIDEEPSAPHLPEDDGEHNEGASAPPGSDDNRRSDHDHDSRRDSQLGQLGLDFGSPSSTSLSRDNTLPLYRP